MSGPEVGLDRQSIRRAFDRAARDYDSAARLQTEVRDELLARLDFFQLQPSVVLDLGAGTGVGSLALKRRFPRAQVIALDLATGMLEAARRRSRPWRRLHGLQAEAAALPLATHSVDLVFSSLMIQWCQPPQPVFAEWQRVLRPGGLVLFSSLGPETLVELRGAWAAADSTPHVSDFLPVPALAGELQQAGLAEPVLDVERRQRPVALVETLMTELRTLGARNAQRARARGLTTPRRLQAMRAAYESLREASGLPVTWEIVYGAVFSGGGPPSAGGRRPSGPAGESLVPLSSIGRRGRG